MACEVGSNTGGQAIMGMERDSELAGDREGGRRRCRSAAAPRGTDFCRGGAKSQHRPGTGDIVERCIEHHGMDLGIGDVNGCKWCS